MRGIIRGNVREVRVQLGVVCLRGEGIVRLGVKGVKRIVRSGLEG